MPPPQPTPPAAVPGTCCAVHKQGLWTRGGWPGLGVVVLGARQFLIDEFPSEAAEGFPAHMRDGSWWWWPILYSYIHTYIFTALRELQLQLCSKYTGYTKTILFWGG
jgi:hypothetical protein